MTTVVAPADAALPQTGVRTTIGDIAAITWRNLTSLRRTPQLLVFSTIQPVVFVLMFRYVFGGAIVVPGESYVNFLMPGIFAQTVMFGAMGTAVGLATDLQTGIVERFRSLPMARSAVLAGRTFADLTRNVFVVLLMAAVGFLVGFRIQTNAWAFAGSLVLMVLFGYAVSWIFAIVGLAVRDPETAQAASFPVLAPIVFASSAFVPVSSMPGWLQGWAENQPLSVVTDAARDLALGGPTAADVLAALAWCIGIVAVAAPIAVRLYRRVA